MQDAKNRASGTGSKWGAGGAVLVWAVVVGWGATFLSEATTSAWYQADLRLPNTAGLLTLLPFALTAIWGARLVEEKHASRWALEAMAFAVVAGAWFWLLMLWYGNGLVAADVAGSEVSSTSGVVPFALSVGGGFLLGIGSLAFLEVWPGSSRSDSRSEPA